MSVTEARAAYDRGEKGAWEKLILEVKAEMPCYGCENMVCDGWWTDRYTPISGCCAMRQNDERCDPCKARSELG